MGEKFEIGNFGHAHFVFKRNGQLVGHDCYGRIEFIEKKFVWFRDNEDQPYLVDRNDFQFEVCEFKDKSK
jgi:hypothetical protein